MSAAIGVTNLFGIASPTGCVVNESSIDRTVEIKTIKSQAGVTVRAVPAKMSEHKISIKGKGIPALSLVAADSAITEGDVVVNSISVDESNEDFPDFTLEAIAYVDL